MNDTRRYLVAGAIYAIEGAACDSRTFVSPIGWALIGTAALTLVSAVVLPASAAAMTLRHRLPATSRAVAYAVAFGIDCLVSLPIAPFVMLLAGHAGDVRADLLAWAVVTGLGVVPVGAHLAMTEFERSGRALPHVEIGPGPFLLGWLVTGIELPVYVLMPLMPLMPHMPHVRGPMPMGLVWLGIAVGLTVVALGATALGSTPARALTVWVMRRTGVSSWRAAYGIALGIAFGMSVLVTVLWLLLYGGRAPLVTGMKELAVFFGLAILPVLVQTRLAVGVSGLIRRPIPPAGPIGGAC